MHVRTVLFEQLISHVDAPGEILPLLVDAAVEVARADGGALVTMAASGDGRVVASHAVPEAIASWQGEVETMDDELGVALAAASGGAFSSARTFALVSEKDVFGALVLFFRGAADLSEVDGSRARSLAALAAMAVAKDRQYEALARSYAELRASRIALEQGEKLRALGQMAAGISHDLKNILNPLSLHLQIAQRAARAGQPVLESTLEEMRGIVRRGVETAERLRAFSRQQTEPESSRGDKVDPNVVVAEVVELCRPRLRASATPCTIAMVKDLGTPPLVRAQSTDFVAAVLNLVVNAIDAVQSRGTITLATGASGGGGWVKVTDDGPGIPEALRARIFEPFFTTKGDAGTGLGLAMVFAFAKRCGGRLTLDSAPGAGASFTLWLPAA